MDDIRATAHAGAHLRLRDAPNHATRFAVYVACDGHHVPDLAGGISPSSDPADRPAQVLNCVACVPRSPTHV